MTPCQGSRLDSWKEIARYLQRNERTVMRWAEERGLPVHRVPGGSRRTVFALTAEINAWLLSQPEAPDGMASRSAKADDSGNEVPGSGLMDEEAIESQKQIPRFARDNNRENSLRAATPELMGEVATSTYNRGRLGRSWLILGIGLVALTAALSAGAFWTTRTARGNGGTIDTATLNVDTLEAKDATGRVLWSHKYESPFETGIKGLPIAAFPTRVADFWGDGRQEVAAGIVLKRGPNQTDYPHNELDFFSGDGKLLWRYTSTMTMKFGQFDLTPPWNLTDMHAMRDKGQINIYVVEAVHTWGNSVIEELDSRTGKNRLRFVNTGAMYNVNHVDTSAGTFLMAGGFNNEWEGSSEAFVSAEKPFAASPQTPGTRHECKSCPPGAPDYYFVFPRSELNRLSDSYNTPVVETLVGSDEIEIHRLDRLGLGPELTIYVLEKEPPFRVKAVRVNTEYQALHKKWFEEGKLNHRYEDCPELLHPLPVKVWTPAGGWTELQVPGTKAN